MERDPLITRRRSGPRPRPGGRAASIAALLLALLVTGPGCGRKETVTPGTQGGELPDQEVKDFVLSETDEGRLEWKLYARYAAMYDARNVIIARGIRVDFFDEQQRKTSELSAREGEINQSTRDMTASGGVIIQTAEGTRMTTEQMRFVNDTQRIVSDLLVRVERSGDELSGYGFESDPELRHFEFKRQVSATVRTGTGGLLEPRSPKK